jgi:hypothetical protein
MIQGLEHDVVRLLRSGTTAALLQPPSARAVATASAAAAAEQGVRIAEKEEDGMQALDAALARVQAAWLAAALAQYPGGAQALADAGAWGACMTGEATTAGS